MSSEISIDSESVLDARKDEGFRPWHFFVLASILIATVAVVLTRRSAPEDLILLSLTIGAAGAAAGALYRMLVPLVSPEETQVGTEPLTERTRAALHREKTLVLRSIKELEFDRAMGKLSQKDCDEMVTRLRARALSLMKQLDAGTEGYAATIERDLRARLAASPQRAQPEPPVSGAGGVCAACGIPNDLDAVFCKKCGTRLQT